MNLYQEDDAGAIPETDSTSADAPVSDTPDTEETDETTPDNETDEADGEETALVPKSLFMGKEYKPGDTVTLKILHSYDDEVEVCCEKESKNDGGSEMDKAMSRMGAPPSEA